MEVPQPFRAPLCCLAAALWRIFSSISSEFPLLELLPLPLILSLQEPASILYSHLLGRWTQPSDLLPPHLFFRQLQLSEALRTSPSVAPWLTQGPSTGLASACHYLSCSEKPQRNTAHTSSPESWAEGKHSLPLSCEHALAQRLVLFAFPAARTRHDLLTTCRSLGLPGPVLQSCFLTSQLLACHGARDYFIPHTGLCICPCWAAWGFC